MAPRFRPSALTAFLVWGLATASCGGQVEATGDGTGTGDGEGEFADRPDATIGSGCGEVRPIEVTGAAPPDLLLVVDKSGSMADPLFNGQQKWNTMRSALGAVVTGNSSSINFGLMLYPTDDICQAGQVTAPVTAGSSTAVTNALSNVFPDGGTPTHSSLGAALNYFQNAGATTNNRYVLLATDGEPNCVVDWDATIPGINQSIDAITALKQAGIPTYVLGFGNGVNSSTLESMAQAGGTGKFYAANSPVELTAALDAIAGEVGVPACSFALSETPEDPARLRLFFDNTEVARSTQHTTGWDYNPTTNTMSVYGASCDQLQSGDVGNMHVDYGCTGVQID